MSSCTSEHSIEHALSAYHPSLPHGAGLISISLEYYKLFTQACAGKLVDMARALGKHDASKPADFIDALHDLQVACKVDQIKLSDYGVDPSRFGEYADNARTTMGGLFGFDAREVSREDIIGILTRSYR